MNVNFNTAYTPIKNNFAQQNGATKPAVQPSFGKKIVNEKTAKHVEDLGIWFDSAMQRFLMGVLAFATQPFIDSKNKDVDEETRKASVARTKAKIIAGTTTGVIIREACIQATKLFTQNDNIRKYEHIHARKTGEYIPKEGGFKKWQQALIPGEWIQETADAAKTYAKKNLDAVSIKRLRNTVGTIAALVVMMYTNFAWDAPLTTFLTNKIYKPKKEQEPSNVQNTEVIKEVA